MSGRIGNKKDLDALAFITAAGIVDTTQQLALYVLVSSLKLNNLWNKMKAIYPIVGGNAISHKFNLKDPRDLDAAYRLIFNGVTHSNNGIFLTDGINGGVDTRLSPLNNLITDNAHLSNYCVTDTNGLFIDMYAYGPTDLYFAVYQRANNLATLDMPGNITAGRVTVTNTISKGFYIGTRTSINSASMYKNGISILTTSTPRTLPIPSNNLKLLRGDNGYPSNRIYAFFSAGDGLTDADALNFYNIVQQYQTTLGRQV